MKIELPAVLLLSIFLSACGPSRSDFQSLQRNVEDLKQENQALQDEVLLLKQENDKLKEDIENYYMGPQRLLSRAQNYLKDRQYADAKETLALLAQKHPNSCEALLAKDLAEQVRQGMAADKTAAAEGKKRQPAVVEKKDYTEALAKMRTNVDAAANTTWYEDRALPQAQNASKIFLSISVADNKAPILHLTVQYSGKKWLDVESFTIFADHKKFDSSLMKFERGGVGSGYIWEYIDMSVGPAELEWIRAVIGSKKTVIQYRGELLDATREIPQLQKNALQNVLDAFAALGGTLPK